MIWIFLRKPQIRFFFSFLKTVVPKEQKSWLFLLKDVGYIKENLYTISEDPKSIYNIFQAFLFETNAMRSRPSLKDFESFYFRNMVKIIACYIQLHKAKLDEMDLELLINTLNSYAQIYERFGGCLKSSKTILFTNKIWKTLYIRRREITLDQAFIILETMVLLDYKNYNFMEIVFDNLKKKALSLEIGDCLKVIKAMSQLNQKKEDVLEVLIDRIYPKIEDLKTGEIALLALNLSKLRFKVNKHFLLKLMKQFYQNFEAQKTENKLVLVAFGAFCNLESLIGHKFFYLDELDEFYEGIIKKIVSFGEILDLRELGYLANGLQKIGVYDEKVLGLILRKSEDFLNKNSLVDFRRKAININREEKEDLLEDLEKTDRSSIEYKEKLIEYKRIQIKEITMKKLPINRKNAFEHYVRIINAFAFFYYEKSRPFIQFFLKDLLKLLKTPSINILDFIDLRLISRFLYSTAILLSPDEISGISLELLNILSNEIQNYKLDVSDITALKILYLYLKQRNFTNSFPEKLLKILNESIKNEAPKSQSSYVSLEVAKTLDKMEISHRFEPIIEEETLTADLMIQYKDQTIFIDIHGFQHYCRNIERLKGGGVLKMRIFKAFGDNVKYVIIPIFEWQLLNEFQERKQYLEKIL